MSFIKKKASRIWTLMKSLIGNDVEKQHHEVRVVKPRRSLENYDDENNVEAEHLSTYRTIWQLINSLAYIVGVNVCKELEWNSRVVFIISLICFGFSMLFYTMAMIGLNAATLIEVICIFGVLLPATLKYRLVLKESKQIPWFHSFFEKILLNNPKGRRAEHLAKEMRDAFKNVKIMLGITLLCFAVFALYPMHAYINENQLVPVMRMEFPFLDQTNIEDYLIALAITLFCATLATIGSVGFDLLTSVLLMEYGSLVTQIVLDLEDYHEIWTNKESFCKRYQDLFLRNMCLKYQDLNNFIRLFDKLFSANICQSICILYGSLIFAFYAVFNNGWISGYGFCIFCFVQLWIPCILGTSVNNQNHRLNRAIYFTPWYEYPIDVQKTILMLLHASSFNAKELWIGPFAPMNIKTGLQITKSIYSYYTAMSNLS